MEERTKQSYQAMLDYVKNRFGESGGLTKTKSGRVFPFRSRFEHTQRVVLWAKRLLAAETADEKEVLTAAIFHDVGYSVQGSENHAESGAVLCEDYLKYAGFEENFTGKVVTLVSRHSDKKDSVETLSPELKVLMDADTLDEVGPMTVLWDAMDAGSGESPGYISTCERIEKALVSLEKHRGNLKTGTGNRWFAEKTDYLRTFTEKLRVDLGMDEMEKRTE